MNDKMRAYHMRRAKEVLSSLLEDDRESMEIWININRKEAETRGELGSAGVVLFTGGLSGAVLSILGTFIWVYPWPFAAPEPPTCTDAAYEARQSAISECKAQLTTSLVWTRWGESGLVTTFLPQGSRCVRDENSTSFYCFKP